jgi:hypothetical protein
MYQNCKSPRTVSTGDKLGKLTAVVKDPDKPTGNHWVFDCDCGRRVSVQLKDVYRSLRLFGTRSCSQSCAGRGKPRPWKRKPPGEAAANAVLVKYKQHARYRGLTFCIEDSLGKALFQGDCHYCGSPPSSTYEKGKYFGEFVYNGIDRMDNDVGYEPGNVVSCCPQCNFAKRILGHDDFIAWVRKVFFHTATKGFHGGCQRQGASP